MSAAANLATFTLYDSGSPRTFTFPDRANMRAEVFAILGGQSYALPRLGRDYRPSVVVDIGANIGASALWFRKANPAARVVCFEPSASNFALLSANLGGLPGVECYPYGLFNADRAATLHLGANQCMQHSIIPSIETGDSTETIELRGAAREFDRLALDRVSILKIDTEGCELPILQDLGPRLDRVELLYLEYHSEEDRVAIDRLLAPAFVLASARAHMPHRGVNLYAARALAASVPAWEAMRLHS